jgi:hypothetical protein
MERLRPLIPFLIPILLLQLGMMSFALLDLKRRQATKGPKWAWVLIILFFSIIGPSVYLIVGRED